MKTEKRPMSDEELYTSEELAFFRQIEAGNYVALPEEELEIEKMEAKEAARNTIDMLANKKPIRMTETPVYRYA